MQPCFFVHASGRRRTRFHQIHLLHLLNGMGRSRQMLKNVALLSTWVVTILTQIFSMLMAFVASVMCVTNGCRTRVSTAVVWVTILLKTLLERLFARIRNGAMTRSPRKRVMSPLRYLYVFMFLGMATGSPTTRALQDGESCNQYHLDLCAGRVRVNDPLFAYYHFKNIVESANACALPGVSIKFDTFVPAMWRAVSMGYVDKEKAQFIFSGRISVISSQRMPLHRY